MLPTDELASGALFAGRFRLMERLGQGGAGDVVRAHDLLHDRSVALKRLRQRDGARDPQLEESVREEFRVLRSLAHPGIVRVYELGYAEDGTPFYTMELLEGCALDAASARPSADDVLEQVAQTLDFLHAHGLVHSDLKPSNIFLLGKPPRLKLADFGLVQRARVTKRDQPYGTLAYMPPERLRASEGAPSPREDLYALGAIVYEVLVGRAPYLGATSEETIAAILAGELEHELAPVPEDWARLLRRLLHNDPNQRPGSAWELLQQWASVRGREQPVQQAWELPFVGRRRELGIVRGRVSELSRGRGAFLHVSGAPGVGKSAFLNAASAQIAAAGIPTWSFDVPRTPRALALVESLATLYSRWRAALPGDAAQAAERLSAWPAGLHEATRSEEVLNANAHALADIGTIATVCPHAIIIDDAHRLDSGSKAVISLMALGMQDIPVLLLVGARTSKRAGEGDEDVDSLAEMLRVPFQAGAGYRLPLHELSAEDVAALVQRRFGRGREFELLSARLADLTHGHPFFVVEALQNLVLTEQLRRDRHGWVLAPHTERKLLPRMADTILSDHIETAPAEHRKVLETLALLPAGATAEVLARILGQESGAVDLALRDGIRVGLLSRDVEAQIYSFRHELIREACAARWVDANARRAHLRIAEVLRGTGAEAYHRLQAGERTRDSHACFLEAATAYESRRAPREALRYYEAALDIDAMDERADDIALQVARLRLQVGRPEDATNLMLQRLAILDKPELRARYLHRLGEAYGKQGRYDEALFHMHAATPLFRKHADSEEQCSFNADLVNLLIAKGDYDAAVLHARQAIQELPQESPPKARAGLILGQAQAEERRGDYPTAEATCRQALEILKPFGRTRELAQTYTRLGTNFHFRAEFDQAQRYHRAALKVYQELGDLHGMMNSQNNLGLAQMRGGTLDAAIESFEQSLDLKRQLGDLRGQGSGLNNLGNLWERRGDYLRAVNCYRHSIRIFRRLQRPSELATLLNNMGEIQLRVGRLLSAIHYLERAAEQAAGLGGAYITHVVALNRGATLVQLMRHDEAVQVLNAALQRARNSGLTGLLAQNHALLALAYARADESHQTEMHNQQALAAAADIDNEARMDAFLSLAEAAEAVRRPDQVATHATAAEELARSLERPHARVRALRLMAAARHQVGDWDVAESLLEEAIQLCESLGFRYERAKCYRLLGVLHWDIGLRARAASDFGRCFETLEGLGLKTELGLTYLEFARLRERQVGS